MMDAFGQTREGRLGNLIAALFLGLTCLAGWATAQQAASRCAALPKHADLKSALDKAVADDKSGLNNHMWATLVDRDGTVCAVAFSGKDRGSQWLASRVISAQKANTASMLSLDGSSSSNGSGQAKGLALSTGNLYSAVQPGGSLYGLQFSNPVDPAVGYRGPSSAYGTAKDPMVGAKIGGINIFGGGLPLYGAGQKLIGAVGLSGDTACTDHAIAWLVRKNLNLDHMAGVGGVSGDNQRPDNIVHDIDSNGKSSGGWGHPKCANAPDPKSLPAVQQ
jgi:uncharacterized protein GlcG (DUF336 family)